MNPALEQLKSRFASLDQTYRQYSMRERLLIAAMVAGAVFFALDNLLIQAVSQERSRVDLGIERTRAEIASLQEESLALTRVEMSDEERRIADEGKQLRLQIAEIDKQMKAHITSLVPPEAIVSVLEELLAGESELELVRLQSQAPVRIGAPDDASATEVLEKYDPGLYRHGLRMQIEGSFAATLAYLQKVEDSQWSLLWERLDYRVDQFPQATITIDLHTISEQEEWIGV